MQSLSSLDATRLAAALEECGAPPGATARVAAAVPFADDAAVLAEVDRAILDVDAQDLPRALAALPAPAIDESGDPAVGQAARLALHLYRDRFGYPFVSAVETPTADELLMRVRIRLGNEPEPEGRAAREHLRRIVRNRLARYAISAE